MKTVIFKKTRCSLTVNTTSVQNRCVCVCVTVTEQFKGSTAQTGTWTTLTLELKQPELLAEHSPQTSTEVNAWNYACRPKYRGTGRTFNAKSGAATSIPAQDTDISILISPTTPTSPQNPVIIHADRTLTA